MEKVGFLCLVLLVYSSADTNSPRTLQEEQSEPNRTLDAELEDQGNVLIEVRNDPIHDFRAHSI